MKITTKQIFGEITNISIFEGNSSEYIIYLSENRDVNGGLDE